HVPAAAGEATAVVVVTLNRPAKHNAFMAGMAFELIQAFTYFRYDDRVKCVVLTGAGKKAFCAGADLEMGFPTGKEERESEHRDLGGQVALAINNCRKTTIAALNGSAVGIGITMVLPCTIRLATAGSKIGFVFARRGIVLEAVSSFFLPRLVGYARALHVTATGDTYAPDDPLLGPLFSEVCATPERTLERALQLADAVARNCSTVAVALMRDMMYRNPGSPEETHILDSRMLYGMFGKGDNLEGVRSFLEKRKPEFNASFFRSEDLPPVYPWWTPVDAAPLKVKSKM
ncbi:hypothetical protein KEM52_003170, partial [Ascosphaera acerosa]